MADSIDDFDVTQCFEFTAEEYRDRWRRLREFAGGFADAAIISSPETLRYFCGYRSLITRSKWRPVILTIPIDKSVEPFILIPAQEVGNAKALTPITEHVVAYESVARGHDDPIEKVVEALAAHGLGSSTLGIELGFGQRLGMTLGEMEHLRRSLSEARFVDIGPGLAATRAIKSTAEIEFLRRACEISCLGVMDGFEQLVPGMTERQLHRVMVQSMIERGADEVWLAVGSGAKGYGVFNGIADDVELRAGDLIWVDGGAYYRGYVCDFIRSAVIGEPSPDQRTWYDVSLEANRAALEAVGPNVEMGVPFARALEVLEAHGMASSWGLDVLGHGIGLEIHEMPALTKDSTELLRPGHVITIEPTLSPRHHSHGHYIIEEVAAVTPSGRELLTSALAPDLWIA